jgi:hypothetical protein
MDKMNENKKPWKAFFAQGYQKRKPLADCDPEIEFGDIDLSLFELGQLIILKLYMKVSMICT